MAFLSKRMQRHLLLLPCSWRVHPRLAESVDVLLGSQLLEHGVRCKPHAQLRQLIHPGASAAQSLLSPLHGLEDDEGSEEEAGGLQGRRHGRGQRTAGSGGGNLLGGGGGGWQGVVVCARFETALAAQRALLA